METYFHNDPRIHEWIDQITEKIFTVCLLKGVDAETEFNKGCQIVTKLTMLLQSISTFPAEYLEDGVKQLIEQQLPDMRIINNFSSFHEIKKRMLKEGIETILIRTTENSSYSINPLDSATDVKINATNVSSANQEIINPGNSLDPRNVKYALDLDKDFSEKVTPVFSTQDKTSIYRDEPNQETDLETGQETNQSVEQELLDSNNNFILNLGKPAENDPQSELLLAETTLHDEPVTASDLLETNEKVNITSHQSVGEERLERVLLTIYPNKAVHWNIKVADQLVYAKIEDLLICLHDANNPCNIKKMNQQGWKVFVCRKDDLMFPRRLEREIHQILRRSKKKLPIN